MKELADKTLIPAEAPKDVPTEAAADAPPIDEALYATRRLEDLTLVPGPEGDPETATEVAEEGESTASLDPFDSGSDVVTPVVEEGEGEFSQARGAEAVDRPSGDGPESEASASRRRLGALWKKVRASAPSRPLQINELAQVSEEHLRAAAMASLGQLFLPTVVSFRISPSDFENLMPFDEYIEKEIGAVYERIAQEPGFAILVPRPGIEIHRENRLSEGDPPQVTSYFSFSHFRAQWRRGQKPVTICVEPAAEASDEMPVQAAPAAPGEASAAIVEILATPGAGQATARQSLRVFCLTPTMPLSLVDTRARRGEKLLLGESGEPETEEGRLWQGGPWESLPPIAELPELEAPLAAEMAEPPLFLFQPPGRPAVCWAPGGLVVVGRDPRRANWVPDGAPPNLSGRHLALGFDRDGQDFFAVDLGSTNGLFVRGSRLPTLGSVRVEIPCRLAVGTEKSLDLEIYPATGMRNAARVAGAAPKPGTAKEDLDEIPLR